MNSSRKLLIIVEAEPLCDLLPLASEPTETGLQAYALPARPLFDNVKIFNKVLNLIY